MSQWNQRFKDHPIWKTPNDLGPAIDQALEKKNNEPLTVEMLSRLKAAQSFVGRRLAGADRYLLSPAPLDNMNGAIQAATADAYRGAQEAALQTSRQTATSCLTAMLAAPRRK